MAVPKDHASLETSIGEFLDDGDFHELDRRLGRFNLFEAVGGVRAELRHSNLGFVFSPNGSHGLGSVVLERTLRAITATNCATVCWRTLRIKPAAVSIARRT